MKMALHLAVALILLASLPVWARSPISADKTAITAALLQKQLGRDFIVEPITGGYELTSRSRISFLPTSCLNSKKDAYELATTARRDFLRIKILLGPPLSDLETCSLSINDYVLPISREQERLGFYPCSDLEGTDCLADYFRSHRIAPIYIFSNSAPSENTYPDTATDLLGNAVNLIEMKTGMDRYSGIED